MATVNQSLRDLGILKRQHALEGAALTGFINDVNRKGIVVDDPLAFLKAEQDKVFDWAPTAPDALDADFGGPKFIQFFDPVLDALRALGGSGSPKAVGDWIMAECSATNWMRTARQSGW